MDIINRQENNDDFLDFGREIDGKRFTCRDKRSLELKRETAKRKTENFSKTKPENFESENFSKSKSENFSELKIENFSASKKSKIEKISDFDQFEKIEKKTVWPFKIEHEDIFIDFIIHRLWRAIRKKSKENTSEGIREFFDELIEIRTLAENCQSEDEAFELIYRANLGDFPRTVFRKINPDIITRELMVEKNFGVEKKDKARHIAEREIKLIENKDGFSIVRNGKVIKTNASKADYSAEIENFVKEYDKKMQKTYRKINKIDLPILDNFEQDDKFDSSYITSNVFQDEFGFYGGTFGIDFTFQKRKKFLPVLYTSLRNLSEILGISLLDISHKGNIGIALGTQKSGINFPINYNSNKKVISFSHNTSGAGYLSKAWFDSLNFYLASIHDLIGDYYTNYTGEYESLNALNRYVRDQDREFYKNSKYVDEFEKRSTPFWSKPEEMLSRAFTSYISDKLKENGITDEFLTYEFDVVDDKGEVLVLYPEDNEREELNKLFDEFFNELRDKQVLRAFDIKDLSR